MIETSAGAAVVRAICAQVAERGNSPAICAPPRTLTYHELEHQANRLAGYLSSLGIGTDVLVGICLPRSLEMIVGMLGIWKAGGAYLPLDPASPADRLASILKDAQVGIVLSTPEIAKKLARTGCRFVWPGMLPANLQSSKPPEVESDPGDLAYLIYTSGSTGVPKGVAITHGGLANLVAWHQAAFSVTHADRASHLAGLGFDAAVWELWPYLASGASIHLVDEAARNSPEMLRDWLLAAGITISFVPTPLAERLLTLSWPEDAPLRILLTGGDTLHHYPPAGLPFQLVNNYGPTECTVVVTSAVIGADNRATALPPIGRPIANTKVYILDQDLRPAPAGTPGEICVAGAGLARGYHHSAELTAEKFVDCRITPAESTRIYRTGDLGRILPDGQIEFLGRLDDQIKIRGYRIEPNEIAGRLNQHPDVRQSLVIAREEGGGEKRLVAYLVLAPDSAVTDASLFDFLRVVLPDYMLPSAFVRIEGLPLTSSGKIDRNALPVPPDPKTAGGLPNTPVEQTISNILADLLNLPGVGRNDNFFLLGGHSLLGAQLIARLRTAFGLEISLRTLFEAPTVADLSSEIEQRIASRSPELSDAK